VQSARPWQQSKIVQPPPKPTEPIRDSTSTVAERPRNALTRTIAIGAVLVLAVAAGSFFVVTRDSAPPPPLSKAPPDSRLPPNEPAPATAPPAPVANELPVAKPVDPIEAIEQIFQARNPDHEVTVMVKTPQVVIGKDRMHFSIRSFKAGFVYLMYVGSDRSLLLLFPNAKDKNNSISATGPLELPRPSWPMVADGPPSTDQFVAIVSESPRDFSDVGLQPIGKFATFPLAATLHPERANTGTAPVFAGKAKCAGGGKTACPESYGAAMFSIEEIPAR
jgi:hypothetical protein